jgi:hypothetical protein
VSNNLSRRSLLGGLLAGLLAPFCPRRAVPAATLAVAESLPSTFNVSGLHVGVANIWHTGPSSFAASDGTSISYQSFTWSVPPDIPTGPG